jgi:hypothetical protein
MSKAGLEHGRRHRRKGEVRREDVDKNVKELEVAVTR